MLFGACLSDFKNYFCEVESQGQVQIEIPILISILTFHLVTQEENYLLNDMFSTNKLNLIKFCSFCTSLGLLGVVVLVGG